MATGDTGNRGTGSAGGRSRCGLSNGGPVGRYLGSYTATSGVVTLTHDGGDELTARSTTRLAVYVTDADTNATTRLTWANGSTLPLSEGATFAVDDPRVDSNGDQNFLDGDGSVGFSLADEDTVEVVWTGRLIGAPGERSTAFYTDTVGNMTN